MDKLQELAQPLIEYLKENYNPYTTVCVSMDKVELVNVITSMPRKATLVNVPSSTWKAE